MSNSKSSTDTLQDAPEELKFMISPYELSGLILRTEAHIEILRLTGLQGDPQKLLDALNDITGSEAEVNANFAAAGVESIPLSREILFVLFDDAVGDLCLRDILNDKFGEMAEFRYDEIFIQNHKQGMTQEGERIFAVETFLQVFAEFESKQEKENV